jgi:hypothetical protein
VRWLIARDWNPADWIIGSDMRLNGRLFPANDVRRGDS